MASQGKLLLGLQKVKHCCFEVHKIPPNAPLGFFFFPSWMWPSLSLPVPSLSQNENERRPESRFFVNLSGRLGRLENTNNAVFIFCCFFFPMRTAAVKQPCGSQIRSQKEQRVALARRLCVGLPQAISCRAFLQPLPERLDSFVRNKLNSYKWCPPPLHGPWLKQLTFYANRLKALRKIFLISKYVDFIYHHTLINIFFYTLSYISKETIRLHKVKDMLVHI